MHAFDLYVFFCKKAMLSLSLIVRLKMTSKFTPNVSQYSPNVTSIRLIVPVFAYTCPTGPSALDKPKDRRERRSKQGLWPSLRIVEQLAKT